MTLYYAKSTGGFYSAEFHGDRTLAVIDPSWTRATIKEPDQNWVAPSDDPQAKAPLIDVPDMSVEAPTITVPNPGCQIPADAVEITAEEHAYLLAAQSDGKAIQADEAGKPVAVDPPPPPLATLKGAKMLALNEAIATLETEQHRATREALNALLSGTAPADIAKTQAGQRLAALDSQIATLRARFAQIQAAESATELEAIT